MRPSAILDIWALSKISLMHPNYLDRELYDFHKKIINNINKSPNKALHLCGKGTQSFWSATDMKAIGDKLGTECQTAG